MDFQRIAISWQLTDTHGWGIFGLNLALRLLRHGPIPPLLLTEPYIIDMPDGVIDELRPSIAEMRQLVGQIEARGKAVYSEQIVVLHALGANFQHTEISDQVRGGRNIGFTFFEEGGFDKKPRRRILHVQHS